MYFPKYDKSLAAFGFKQSDFSGDEVNLWPEHVYAYHVFSAMSTQWQVGYSGRVGLRYEVLSELWRRLKITPENRDEIFDCLQVMEGAVLEEDAIRREASANKPK